MRRRGKISERGVWILLIVPLYQISLMVCFFLACRELTDTIIRFGVMMLFFGFGVDAVILMVLARVEEKQLLEERLARLYEQRQLELDYYEMRHQDTRKLEEVKTRLLDQLRQAESLLEEKGEFSQVREVMESADRMMKQTQVYRFCENPLVNAVLTMKGQRAAEMGVEAEFKVRVEEGLAVEPLDLCSLFCNLIDNALEACARIEDDSLPKKMEVKADCRGGCLVLQVRNTSTARWNRGMGRPLTGKKEGDHGLGLKLVERTVNRYQGNLQMEQEENQVRVNVILNYAAQAAL